MILDQTIINIQNYTPVGARIYSAFQIYILYKHNIDDKYVIRIFEREKKHLKEKNATFTEKEGATIESRVTQSFVFENNSTLILLESGHMLWQGESNTIPLLVGVPGQSGKIPGKRAIFYLENPAQVTIRNIRKVGEDNQTKILFDVVDSSTGEKIIFFIACKGSQRGMVQDAKSEAPAAADEL